MIYFITNNSYFINYQEMNVLTALKKAVASFSVFALLATLVPVNVFAAANLGFTDDAQIPAWAEEAIEELMFQGVLSGNDDGSFAPARQLNRAEVAKIIVLATGVSCNTPATPTFPDVQPGDWFYDYVECMADYGWINGYPDGYFRPAVGINRAEIAKMVVNAFDIDQDLTGAPHFSDVAPSDWFYGYVETAYNAGVMQGYTASTFSPASAVTRAETARIVYDAQLYIYNDWEPEFSDGSLQVGLSLDTPAGTSIPFNATAVPYTTVEFMAATDSDVEVGRVTFTRLGLGDNDDFDNCWMEVDGFKIGSEKSVTQDDTVEITFNPPVVVPAGQTLVGDLVCSHQYDATGNTTGSGSLDDRNIGHRNRFAIIGPEDILSTAVNVMGDFPIEGEEMTVADYRVSEIEFEDLGSDTTIEVGDIYAEIGKFRLLNDSATGKDIEVRAITFENDGNAELEEVLFDTALYVGGDQVSYETIIDGDYITFRLDDGITGGYIIEDGDSRVFSIRSDIVTAENGDTIQFKLDNYEDLVAIEIGTSFGVRAVDENGNEAEDRNATLALYSIDSGDLNISRHSNNPGNEEYAPGSNEVLIQSIRAVVGQPMRFDGVTFNVATGSAVSSKDGDTTANELADFNETFDNFRLYINDSLVDTEDNLRLKNGGNDGTVTNYVIEFDTSFELANTSEIRLVANIENDAETGDQIKTFVRATDFDSPEYIATGDEVQDDELLGTATGSFVEVELSELIITKTDGFSTGDFIVAGENDVNVLEFTLENNDSGDVNVTSITIGAVGAGAAAVYPNYTLALFMGGVQQGSSRTMNSTGMATFSDLSNVVIPSGDEIEFTLVVNTIESSASNASTVATTLVSSPLSGIDLARTVNAGTSNVNPRYLCLTGVTAGQVQPGSTVRVAVPNSNAGETGYVYDVETGAAGTFSTNGGVNFTCVNAADVAVLVGSNDDAYVSGGGATAYGTEAVVPGTSNFNFTNDHVAGEAMVTLGYVYPTGAPVATYQIYVADASKFSIGEQITLTPATLTGDSTGTLCIAPGGINSATTPNSITVRDCDGGSVDQTAAPSVGDIVTGQAGTDSITFFVKDVEADNVENGQTVETYESGTALEDTLVDNATNHDCDINNANNGSTVPNYLCGVQFFLVNSGTLTVTSNGSTLSSDLLVANETDVPVLEVTLRAANDEIHVTDMYFENDVYNGLACVTGLGDPACQSGGIDTATFTTFAAALGDDSADNALATYSFFSQRAEFKLYNSSGVLLDTAQMQPDGSLHFNLGNSNRVVVPKDDSEVVTVKVDLYNISDAAGNGDPEGETGMRLKLSLDTTNVYRGIEAITAATGDDITTPAYGGANYGWEILPGSVTGEDFVAYRTQPMVKHSASQNDGVSPGPAAQEIYEFTIEADANHEVFVGRLSFDISLEGFEHDGVNVANNLPAASEFLIYEVDSSGNRESTPTLDGSVAGELIINEFGVSTFPVVGPGAAELDRFRIIAEFGSNGQGIEINKGESRTYQIYMANLVDTSVPTDNTDDAITVYIARDGQYVAPNTLAGQQALTIGGELLEVIWSDSADNSHGPTTEDWHGGFVLDIDTNGEYIGN